MQQSGMGFTRAFGTNNIPVWQRDKAFQLAQGGFGLDKTGLTKGQILPAGSPLIYDEAARTAVVLVTAKIYAAANNAATSYQVNKGHALAVGKNLAVSDGGASHAITAIDTTNPLYDTVTLDTTLGVAVSANQTAFVSAAAGATAANIPDNINGLLYEDCVVQDGIAQIVSAVIRATAYARRMAYSDQLAALPGLAQIVYSQSK